MSSYPLFTYPAEGKQVKKTKVKGIAFQLIKYFWGHFAYYLTHILFAFNIFKNSICFVFIFIYDIKNNFLPPKQICSILVCNNVNDINIQKAVGKLLDIKKKPNKQKQEKVLQLTSDKH